MPGKKQEMPISGNLGIPRTSRQQIDDGIITNSPNNDNRNSTSIEYDGPPPENLDFPELKPKTKPAEIVTNNPEPEEKTKGMDNLIASVLTGMGGEEKNEKEAKKEIETLIKTGFFQKLHSHLQEKRFSEAEMEHFMNHDLVNFMHKFHSNKEMHFDHDDYKSKLDTKMESLKSLELEWAASRNKFIQTKKDMEDTEEKISKTILELKEILSNQKKYQVEDILGHDKTR